MIVVQLFACNADFQDNKGDRRNVLGVGAMNVDTGQDHIVDFVYVHNISITQSVGMQVATDSKSVSIILQVYCNRLVLKLVQPLHCLDARQLQRTVQAAE